MGFSLSVRLHLKKPDTAFLNVLKITLISVWCLVTLCGFPFFIPHVSHRSPSPLPGIHTHVFSADSLAKPPAPPSLPPHPLAPAHTQAPHVLSCLFLPHQIRALSWAPTPTEPTGPWWPGASSPAGNCDFPRIRTIELCRYLKCAVVSSLISPRELPGIKADHSPYKDNENAAMNCCKGGSQPKLCPSLN